MNRIFILGAYGQNNLGDEALLEVFMQQFAGSELIVNSAQPDLTAKRYGVEAVGTYFNWPPRFSRLRALWRSDLIVFGGGSLLKETEGSGLSRLAYFFRILLILVFARLTGKRTAMLGNGMGPLSLPLYKGLTVLCARLTDVICVRDNDSRELLQKVGVKREIHVTADAVFTMQRMPGASLADVPVNLDQPYVVVVPRYSLTSNQQVELAKACDHVIEQFGVQVLFLPFQTEYLKHFDDTQAAQTVRSGMRHAEKAFIWVTDNPSAAFEVVGRAQMVLSARLHALIFAAMQGIPPIALSYEVKVRSFMREVGQESYCLDLDGLENGSLIAVADRAWADRENIRQQINARTPQLREASQRNFDIVKSLPSAQGSPLLKASALLLFSMTVVNAGNYVFNLILGRWLGPSQFADLSLMVTLMLMTTFITSTFGMITARFAAIYASQGDLDRLAALRGWLRRIGIILGSVMLLILTLGAPSLSQMFQTQSALPFIILGLGMPWFFIQSVDRGILQGQTQFGWLALSYQVEMWVRLIGAVVLVALGFAVNGAVTAITLSFIATWWVARRAAHGLHQKRILPAEERQKAIRFVLPVSAALISQILINNSDVLIVKYYFTPEEAGHYAALALIGRIVFFATMSVVTTLFPIVAQKHQKGEPHRHLLAVSLGLVGAVSLVILLGTVLLPEWIVNVLFGAEYLSVAPMLWMYALATTFYAMANVVVNYRLSTGRGGGSIFAIVASLAQVGGLLLFHNTLQQVVIVQMVAMGALMIALLIWDILLAWNERRIPPVRAAISA